MTFSLIKMSFPVFVLHKTGFPWVSSLDLKDQYDEKSKKKFYAETSNISTR